MRAIATWLGDVTLSAWAVLALALFLATWLAGLMITLRGSRPKERVALLREYSKCRPWGSPGRKRRPSGDDRSPRLPGHDNATSAETNE